MSTFLLKKQGKSWVLPLRLLENGIRKVKSILLELHPTYASTVLRIYMILLITIYRFKKRKKSLTVEFPRRSKKTTLKDKKIFLDFNSLITNWLLISVRGSISKEKDFKPFWNDQCKEISRKLWLPTKTDYVDLDSNYSNGFLRNTMSQSIYSTEMMVNQNQKNYQTTSFLSSISFPANKWEEEDIRIRKIRIYPTQKQKKIFKSWNGTSRFVYNKALNDIKTGHDVKVNFQTLRNKHVTAKNNSTINDWELETPKDIRAGAIQDLVTAYKSAMTNLNQGNISQFKLGFRRKKSNSSIVIPMKPIDIKFPKNNKGKGKKKLFIYSSYLKSPIKLSNDKCLKDIKIEHDCRLISNEDKWYICIPIKVENMDWLNKDPVCSLDPGEINFQSIYSQERTVEIKMKKEHLLKQQEKLNKLQSLAARKLIKKKHYERRRNQINSKLENQIDDLHYQTINYLTSNYHRIIIPEFKSQELIGKIYSKGVKRNLLSFKHYQFRQRLISKCELRVFTGVSVVTEEYTSKTCGWCGNQENIGGKRVFNCSKCETEIGRDQNGSRNIMIKTLMETLS